MPNHDELIAQFIEISGGEESVARFYLSSCLWSLEDALSNFLGNQADNDNITGVGGGGGSAAAGDPTEAVVDDEDISPAHSSSSRVNLGGNADANSFLKSSAKPKFATLNDMAQGGSSSNEEEGQAFYAGGSERSGQQVLGPPKRKNFREQLTDMFRMAHEHSGGTPDASPVPSTSTGAVAWGQGVRLGMTDSDHTVVTPLSGVNKDASGDKKPVVVLKLWSQGFSIDDGELRLYDDPENKEFLETVMRGEIPHELLEMGWMVNVDVEDHRHEDYKKKPVAKTFKGSGHTLGSPTPNFEGAGTIGAPLPVDVARVATAPAPATATNSTDDENEAKQKLNLNTSAPTTTLQIRLADGSRLAAQFNLTHTVADVHQYIEQARPQYANRTFILVSSFPTRELTDDAVTIEGAGLKNAAVLQRLK